MRSPSLYERPPWPLPRSPDNKTPFQIIRYCPASTFNPRPKPHLIRRPPAHQPAFLNRIRPLWLNAGSTFDGSLLLTSPRTRSRKPASSFRTQTSTEKSISRSTRARSSMLTLSDPAGSAKAISHPVTATLHCRSAARRTDYCPCHHSTRSTAAQEKAIAGG